MNNDMLSMLMSMINMSSNPNIIIKMMTNQSPKAKKILNQVNTSGMSTKDYVLNIAKQNNIDLTPIINEFKKKGIKL